VGAPAAPHTRGAARRTLVLLLIRVGRPAVAVAMAAAAAAAVRRRRRDAQRRAAERGAAAPRDRGARRERRRRRRGADGGAALLRAAGGARGHAQLHPGARVCGCVGESEERAAAARCSLLAARRAGV